MNEKVMVIQPVTGERAEVVLMDKDSVDTNLYSYLKTTDNMETWVPTNVLSHYKKAYRVEE